MTQYGNFLQKPSPTLLKKLKVLVAVRVDTSEIVHHDFDDLVLNVCWELTLLSVLLEIDSAKQELTGARRTLLRGFQQMLEDVAN